MSWTIDELARSHSMLPGDLVGWDDDDPHVVCIGIVLESCESTGHVDVLWSCKTSAMIVRNSTDRLMRLKPC